MVSPGLHLLREDSLTAYELLAAIRGIMEDGGWHSARDIAGILRGRGKNISVIRIANNLRDMPDLVRKAERVDRAGVVKRWHYSKKWR